jgi:hypothetical protein
VNATPATAPAGCVVKPNLAAAPTVMTTLPLTAEANPVSDAVNVYVFARSILHPVKVATPEIAALELEVVHAKVAEPGTVIDKSTVLVLARSVLPPASFTATTGWTPNAAPPVAPTGWVVKTTFDAAPTAMIRPLLWADARPAVVAVNVYVFATSILQAANVATPETAAFVFVGVHASVAEPGTVSASSTEFVAPTTVFPAASCTLTAGWGANAVAAVELPGWVVKANLAAAPTVIVRELLTAEANPGPVAVSV